MGPSNTILQQAMSARRRTKGPLKVWVLLRCPSATCATQEVNVYVSEEPGCKPWQAPCRCPRCGTELHYEGLDE